MKDRYQFLAFDFGAESARAILGTLADGRIGIQQIHRFRTEGLFMLGTRQWDLARLYEEMETGLRLCARDHTKELDGIGVDTWGIDFGLLARDGSVLGNPVHYRDKRTEGMMEVAFEKVPRADIYRMTGSQFMVFNTVFQLLSLARADSPVLKAADRLLQMGDLFSYLLTGKKANEYTNASTTQMLDPHTRRWNRELLDRLGIPGHILEEPVQPGTVLGPLLPDIAARTGIAPKTPVILPATHDTAAAVAAVPVVDTSEPWAYLSSGTWSLLGAELAEPCVTPESLEENFTNEGGVNGTIRFLKNIFGLWIVQECRRAWEREGQQVDYASMTSEAAAAEPFRSVIDVDDPRLVSPEDMPKLIQTICRERGEPTPESRGQIVRCALESLAIKYRQTIQAMDRVLHRTTQKLHIIGGGTQNKLLSQMTADACKLPVIAGPVEGTVLGNIGVQAMAVGAIGSLKEMRAVIGKSFALERYTPANPAAWDRAAARVEKTA